MGSTFHFLAMADRQRESLKALNLGLSDPLVPGIVIRPMLRRRLPLPEGTVELRHGPAATPLTPAERIALVALLDRDASTLAASIETLPDLPAQDVSNAVSGLARKSLVFLSEEPG